MRRRPTGSRLSSVAQQKSRRGGKQQRGRQRRSAGRPRQARPSQQREEEAEARDHAGPQHPQHPAATLESEDRPAEASAAATQQEAVLAAALDGACAVGVEGEGPNECHAGPCAVRYNRDTQCDMSALLIVQTFDVLHPGRRMLEPTRHNGPRPRQPEAIIIVDWTPTQQNLPPLVFPMTRVMASSICASKCTCSNGRETIPNAVRNPPAGCGLERASIPAISRPHRILT